MKSGVIYEVQKFGTTLEFESDYKRVEAAFKGASPGGVVLYKLDIGTCKKAVLARR